MKKNVNELAQHPLNEKIYGTESNNKLKDSIKKSGILVPLSVKADGTIISGHRRFEVAKDIGLESVPVIIVSFDTELAEREAIIEHNRQRDKTVSQKMREADEIEAIEKQRAERRMKAGKKIDPVPNCAQGKKGKTREKVAEAVGMSRGTYSRAKKLYTEAKEDETAQRFLDDVDKGEKSISGALRELKKKRKQKELEAKKKEYQQRVTETPQAERAIDIFDTDMRFRVFYADPPWSYRDKQTHPQLGGANKHYDNIGIQDLCDMPISSLAEDDAVLFLWVTSPILPESFDVIEAWGFTYKASFVWDKVGHNMGHYNSVRHEFLLVCTRGSCTPDKKKLFDSVQSIEKTRKHSEKPEQFRDIIDTLYPHGNRIELFARAAERDTWFYWGNEI